MEIPFRFHRTIQLPIHQTIKPRVFPRFVYSKVGEDGANSCLGARRSTRRTGRISRTRGKRISRTAKQLGAAEAADRNARGPWVEFTKISGITIGLKQ